jgi:hypothetical protein
LPGPVDAYRPKQKPARWLMPPSSTGEDNKESEKAMDVRKLKCRSWAAGALMTIAVAAIVPATASAEVVYNNFPVPLEKNMSSVGFEATSTAEFGGEVGLPPLTARKNPSIIVGMSTWACQSGTWSDNNCKSAAGSKFLQPVTLNVYEVGPGDTVGSQLASTTTTFEMPYRPSASKHCTTGTAKGGYAPPACFHGKLFKITFKLPGVVLPPEKMIVSVAYNTSNYGANPKGTQPCNATVAGCPYDSLNVAVTEGTTPTTGTYPDSEEVDVNSQWNEMYCGNAAPVGTFAPSGKCWLNEQPVFEIKAS